MRLSARIYSWPFSIMMALTRSCLRAGALCMGGSIRRQRRASIFFRRIGVTGRIATCDPNFAAVLLGELPTSALLLRGVERSILFSPDLFRSRAIVDSARHLEARRSCPCDPRSLHKLRRIILGSVADNGPGNAKQCIKQIKNGSPRNTDRKPGSDISTLTGQLSARKVQLVQPFLRPSPGRVLF